jgi:DNA repair protein RecO (recombination protein O)
MGLTKDEAIVLRKLPYGESDRIVHLFTLNSGRLSAIAKGGAKSVRRFMNTLEPLRIIKVEYFDKSGKGLPRIENAHILEDFQGIEEDFRRLSIAFFFMEVVDKLVKERQPYPQMFHILSKVLRNLKVSQISSTEILNLLLEILEILGFLPNFVSCVHCGIVLEDKKKRFFSSEKGGLLCELCKRFHPHRAYPSELLTFLSKRAWEGMESKELLLTAFELMENFMKYHLDVEFKSYRFTKPI